MSQQDRQTSNRDDRPPVPPPRQRHRNWVPPPATAGTSRSRSPPNPVGQDPPQPLRPLDFHWPDLSEFDGRYEDAVAASSERERIVELSVDRLRFEPVPEIDEVRVMPDEQPAPAQQRQSRQALTEEARIRRNARARERRAAETPEQREARLASDRARAAARRTGETSEQRDARLAAIRVRVGSRRTSETSAERDARLAGDRAREQARRASETPDERDARLAEQRHSRSASRELESPELREAQHVDRALRRSTSRSGGLLMAGFSYNPEIDYAANRHVTIGGLIITCQFCSAKRFAAETPGLCCSSGKVRLEPFLPPPLPEIEELYVGLDAVSTNFRRNIRSYNSAFQMTSFGATGSVSNEWSTFKVHGQIYHRMGSLLPPLDQEPRYAQIYFAGDSETQISLRLGNFTSLQESLVRNFQQLFDNHNDLIRQFKTGLDQMQSDEQGLLLRGNAPPGQHPGRFNAPAVDEVALIAIDAEYAGRDIVIRRRDDSLTRICETHPHYDALQYPLIFWNGRSTYSFNIKLVDPVHEFRPVTKTVSMAQYYSYHLMIRDTAARNFILRCGQLLNQFAVDTWWRVEAERLLYIKTHQTNLRAEQYIHLRDAIDSDGDVENIGQKVILPSTFTGSPRNMYEYTQDAMAYVRLYGRPDFFITFTCNPNWPEIRDNMFPGQVNTVRHDIVARVFEQKQQKLLDVLTKHEVFGKTRCFVSAIEWQKRGLPHSHTLIWLYQRVHPDQIDSVISAELPDPEADPELYRIITNQMIHGPCGTVNPQCPCMDNGRCTKRYPRPLIDATQTGNDGYPLYRRRKPDDGGHTYRLSGGRLDGFLVDNSWVVPYNPVLSRMFNAHLNVESCSSIKSIKYVCGYIFKGSDMASVQRQRAEGTGDETRNDEVHQYQIGRYLSSNEAFWRLFGFHIHHRYPTVVQLAVHLENGQRIYYDPNRPERIVAQIRQAPATTLTAFFILCNSDEFARTLLYADVPHFFTWNKDLKRWARRKQGTPVDGHPGIKRSDAIGRMYTIHPRQGDCFYLRLLLTKVRGPLSFEYLKTVEGHLWSTYREACLAHGLINNDIEWANLLREAALTKRPKQLRELFSVIIANCQPSNPRGLWESFRKDLSEDFLDEFRRIMHDEGLEVDQIPTEIYNRALIEIEDLCLNHSGMSLSRLGVPAPQRRHQEIQNFEFNRETGYNHDLMMQQVSDIEPRLNDDQRHVYTTIVEAIESRSGRSFFLDAPGGTGKTFLLNLILAKIRAGGQVIVATASSGIAATLLAGGRTAHSAFAIPTDFRGMESPVCNIKRGTAKAVMLEKCDAIIWDECTMAHKMSLEALDRTLRDIRRIQLPFGKVTIVLAGDFRQTLPVIPRGTAADEINACLKKSNLWRLFDNLQLTINVRAQLAHGEDAMNFSRLLLRIGNGSSPVCPRTNLMQLTPDICQIVDTETQLINSVYPDLERNYLNRDWICGRAILAPVNDVVDYLNFVIQEKIAGQPTRYYFSVDEVADPDLAVSFPSEFLNSLSPPNFPPHQLDLKIGSPIMMLRNLNPPRLCNGTKMVVKGLHNNFIEATIIIGPFKGEDVFIPRIHLENTDFIVKFKRKQFPVRLAYAMTINKSQGQTLDVVGLHLIRSCFSHGQLYVAFSRVGNPSNIFVHAVDQRARNIVYHQAL